MKFKVSSVLFNRGTSIKVITPFDSNDENNIKKRWEIGATYFDREIDPFVEKLIKEYNIQEIEDASETKKYS